MITNPTGQALVSAPASDDSTQRETLAYIEAYDAILDTDYAFVIYRETSRASGEWCVRIGSRHTTGAVFDPVMIRQQARSASSQGKKYFQWGAGLSPSSGDPRCVEYRVHVANGQPAAIEIFVQMRKPDHTADQPKSVIVPWPAPAAA